MPADVFRVSERSSMRRTNALFAKLQTQIYAALVDSTEPRIQRFQLYTSKRMPLYTENEKREMLARCPADVVMAAGVTDGIAAIDSAEIDLIDFLLNYKYNRVLAIMGAVGIGKTTFIRYVLEELRDQCPSLAKFFPVILNCLAIGNALPSFSDLVYEAVRAIKKSIWAGYAKSFPGIEEGVIALCEGFNLFQDRYTKDGNSKEAQFYTSSHFVELFRQLAICCGDNIEPVIVFDNVDQLLPEAVTQICSLATSLHLNSKLPVLTAMRPATYLTQTERVHGANAVYHFRIEVPPPDLRDVVASRMRFALETHGPISIDAPNGTRIEINDINRSIRSLSRKILSKENQDFLLRDLCNNSVRKALAAFAYFLSYHELKLDLLADVIVPEPTKGRGGDYAESWRKHLIDGLMIGDREFYLGQEPNAPFTNLFDFEYDGLNDALILYRILSFLDWSGRYVEVRECMEILSYFGYKESVSLRAITYLLSKGLLFSPESEAKISFAKNIINSTSGTLHLRYLLSSGQYLINVVFDVPLRHEKWILEQRKTFEVSLSSIQELMQKIYTQETQHLTYLVVNNLGAAGLGSVAHAGLLTRRILKAAQNLIDDAYFTRSERAREASESFNRFCEELNEKIVSGEQLLEDVLINKHLIPSRTAEKRRVYCDIGEFNELSLTVPRFVGPANKNVVDFSLKLGDSTKFPNTLALCWQSLEEDGSFEMTHLRRTPGDETFRGEFVLSDVEDLKHFPRSKLTIFSGNNPVIIQNIAAPN